MKLHPGRVWKTFRTVVYIVINKEKLLMVDSRRDAAETSYLHHQDDHPDGSQEELVVIQPLFHFLEAALKKKRYL